MGKKIQTKKTLSKNLEKKVEKYYNEMQKLKLLWEEIISTIQEEDMNLDVFMNGTYTFLDDPIDVLFRLKNGQIDNYDMFIAELEDIIEHYDIIMKEGRM